MQVICAGSLDTFQIFVWATKTARLLDVLAAHEGPVVALAFSPTQPLLASGSWIRQCAPGTSSGMRSPSCSVVHQG